MLSNKSYDCKLYTLEGAKDAVARVSDRLRGNHEAVKVTAKDGSASIYVYRSLAERKLCQEERPTFYAC